MMNFNIEKFQKIALPVFIGGISAFQVHSDYKHADKEDKKNVLKRDLVVLGGTVAGAYAGNKILHRKIPKFISLKSKYIRHLINNLSIPLGGIVGGFIVGIQAEKVFPQKNSSVKEVVDESISATLYEDLIKKHPSLATNVDAGTLGKAYGYLGMGLGSVFDDTFSTLSGFKVGREQGMKNKLLRASNEIIAGVLIPVSTVVSVASYLRTKRMNNFLKIAILAPSAIASSLLGNYVGDKFNQKITENVIKKEFWKKLNYHNVQFRYEALTRGFFGEHLKTKAETIQELQKKVPEISKSPEIKAQIAAVKEIKSADASHNV